MYYLEILCVRKPPLKAICCGPFKKMVPSQFLVYKLVTETQTLKPNSHREKANAKLKIAFTFWKIQT